MDRALAPDGVDVALDAVGSGMLPELIELPRRRARHHGRRLRRSPGTLGDVQYRRCEVGELIESGRFSLPMAQTFPLAEVAEAHRVSEQGHVRGKLVLLVG
jgi:NADPH:quinone reductase-like Zn-dependent oxidoreductase